jgi:hypothetical protein
MSASFGMKPSDPDLSSQPRDRLLCYGKLECLALET